MQLLSNMLTILLCIILVSRSIATNVVYDRTFFQDQQSREIAHSQRYKTEPDYNDVKFDFIRKTNDTSLLSPGYFFLTIAGPEETPSYKAPHIFDNNGHPVWHDSRFPAQDFKVCDYLGHKGNHLSLFSHETHDSYFLDQTYSKLPQKFHGHNAHEFNVLPGGNTVLRIRDSRTILNLTDYGGMAEGFVKDTCFVEVDVKSTKELFRWCYLDELPVWHTTIYPLGKYLDDEDKLGKVNISMRSRKAGSMTKPVPWDFIHANAADKMDGDYLLSARFLDQVIKVAGPDNRHGVRPGTVMWRLGGQQSDFKHNFTFSRQHHTRFVSVGKNETIISFFDNAWEGTNDPSATASSGRIIRVNNVTMEAEQIGAYPHPDNILSEGRGSTQILPNKNVLVGYGRVPDFIEYSENGTILLHVRLSLSKDQSPSLDWWSMDFSYRAVKYPWVGKPLEPPKLVAYSRTCQTNNKSPLVAYVSWNGATEVVSWRFFASSYSRWGPWESLGTFPKKGFETKARLWSEYEASPLRFKAFVRVEALDVHNQVIGSQTAKTWVPKKAKEWRCGTESCHTPIPFYYWELEGYSCHVDWLLPGYISLFLLILALESLNYIFETASGLSESPNNCNNNYSNSMEKGDHVGT